MLPSFFKISKRSAPFLDILVKRCTDKTFLTSAYWKKTFTVLCTSCDSVTPRNYKINLIRTVTCRCFRIYSSPSLFKPHIYRFDLTKILSPRREHRSSRKVLHSPFVTVSPTVASWSLPLPSSTSIDRRQLFLGLYLFCFPFKFHFKAFLMVRRVWPSQLRLLRWQHCFRNFPKWLQVE